MMNEEDVRRHRRWAIVAARVGFFTENFMAVSTWLAATVVDVVSQTSVKEYAPKQNCLCSHTSLYRRSPPQQLLSPCSPQPLHLHPHSFFCVSQTWLVECILPHVFATGHGMWRLHYWLPCGQISSEDRCSPVPLTAACWPYSTRLHNDQVDRLVMLAGGCILIGAIGSLVGQSMGTPPTSTGIRVFLWCRFIAGFGGGGM